MIPVVDLRPEPTPRAVRPDLDAALPDVIAAVEAAGWDGVVLQAVVLLGAAVFPVVELTGAEARVARGEKPERSLSTLAAWEAWQAAQVDCLGLVYPPRPLRVVGFATTSVRWRRAVEEAGVLASFGPVLALRRRRPGAVQLMEADAAGMWVAAGLGSGGPSLLVRGRTGPIGTAVRVPATRLVEEGLFAHALACGAV